MNHPYPSPFGSADPHLPIRRRSRAESSSSWAAGLAGLCAVLFLSLLLPFPALAQAILGGQSIPSRPALPANSVGVDNSYYLDFTTGNVFGPKSLGQWPPAVIANFGSITAPISFISNPSIQSTMTADGGVVTIQNSGLTAGFLNAQFNPVVFNDGLRVTSWNDVGTHVGDVGGISSYFLNTNTREYNPISGRATFQNNSVNFTGYMFCGAAGAFCWNFDWAITDQDQFHNHFPAFLLGEHDINIFDTGTIANPNSQIYNMHVQPAGGVGFSIGSISAGPYGLFTAINVGRGTVAPGHDAFNWGSVYTPTNAPYLALAGAVVNTGTGCTGGAGTGGPFPIIGGTQSFWSSGPTTFNITYDSLRNTYAATAAAITTYTTPPAGFNQPTSLTGTACTVTITWEQGSDSQTTDFGFLTNNYSASNPITLTNNGGSACSLGTFPITTGTLAPNYATGATVTITNLDDAGGISDGSKYPFGITVTSPSGYLPGALTNLPFSGGTITLAGTSCASPPQFTVKWVPASDTVQNWVTPNLTSTPNIFWRDLINGGTFDLVLAGGNIQLVCSNAALASVNCNITAKGTGSVGLAPVARLTTGYTVSAAVASALPVASGAGGVNGNGLYTVAGGTCSTQPQLNLTWTAGVLSVASVATAGSCATPPTSPASLTYVSGVASGWTAATVVLNLTPSLPACAVGNFGTFAYVFDALTPTLGGTLTGGGAVSVFALCAGASGWKAA